MKDILYSLKHLHKVEDANLKAVEENWISCKNLRIGGEISTEEYKGIHCLVCFLIQNGKQVDRVDLKVPFLALADFDSEWVIYLINYQ